MNSSEDLSLATLATVAASAVSTEALPIELRGYQADCIIRLRHCYTDGQRAPLLCLPTAGGKCLGRGTPVLLFDGRIKAVESVRVGDLLMWPDSRARRVVSVTSGTEAPPCRRCCTACVRLVCASED